MKLLSKEEQEAHNSTTVRNVIGGGIVGLAAGVGGVYGASWRYPWFRQLTLPFKAFIITSSGTFLAIIAGDRASRAFEISRSPERKYRGDQAARDHDEAIKQKPTFDRFLAWGKTNRYPIVGASWVVSMGVALALVGRSPYLTTPQKLVQARVYAQGLTLAVLIASAAFEIGDRGNSDGMWETVKVVDPSDPEHTRLVKKEVHQESYRGQDQWKDMVDVEERKLKKRDKEFKAQEELDLKELRQKHKKHKHHQAAQNQQHVPDRGETPTTTKEGVETRKV